MKSIITVLAALAALTCARPGAAVEKLYFGDVGNQKILRCDLNGANRQELVTAGIDAVGGIAIDRGRGWIFWTDWPSATAHIMRADLDGAHVQPVLTGLSGPYGIAVDAAAGHLYWTEFGTPRIRRADLDGGNVVDLVTAAAVDRPAGMALDLDAGKMYWCDGATEYSAKIMRANLDGTQVDTLVTDPLIAPQAIALDPAGDWMYWSDLGTDSWWRAHLDGSGLDEILLSPYGTPVGTALDLAAQKLYLSDFGDPGSVIKRCNSDGTSVQNLITSGIGAVYALTLGPDAPECADSWLEGPWLIRVTDVEPFDYSVYLTFDGAGTIPELGSFGVPDPAGTYAVAPDCGLSGEIWTDSYVPFTGQVLSPTAAELDLGLGMMQVQKVSDPGALLGCWAGDFRFDDTGAAWNVSFHLDDQGNVALGIGFPGTLSGRILTEAGALAGHLVITGIGYPGEEIMFQEIYAAGSTQLWGRFTRDCGFACSDGEFQLHPCGSTGLGGPVPGAAPHLRCSPNPFNPSTSIRFELAEPAAVTLRVYDTAGRIVRTLLDGRVLESGPHAVDWDGRKQSGQTVASGVYFCRLETDHHRETRRMTLLK